MRLFFATFPDYDITLSYLTSYGGEIVDFAEKRGVKVTKLKREKVTRKNVESFLNSNSPGLVVFNGHGSEDCVSGYKEEPLIIAGKNEHLLNSKVVYSTSCSSAAVLGKESVKAGARAFIGYEDDFVFLFDKNRTTSPMKDEIARNFLEPSNALVISLLKGNKVQDAFDTSQESFQRKIDELLTSEALPGTENLIAFLLWDKSVQTFHGDGEAVF